MSAVVAATLMTPRAQASSQSPTPVARPEPLAARRLHIQGESVRDGLGREVLLRGIAVIKKEPPYLPDVGPADFARIRSWGLDSIRLGITWAGVMPKRGVIDGRYLDRLRALVDQAAAAGLYVVVDMHQDLFGEPVGNGAPVWATHTDCPHVDLAAVTGAWSADYLSPAVGCAFTNFWTGSELQAAYTDAWRAVAARLADQPLVAGYDLMNEPFQGYLPPAVFERGYLYPSQARWLAAIRTVHPGALGFFEPPNSKNVHAPTVPAAALPSGSVYAPHLYGLWDASEQAASTRGLADANFGYSRAEAGTMGTPLWLGEFGVQSASPGGAEFVGHVFDLADQARAGVAYWEYQGSYSPVDEHGNDRPLLAAIVRAYPAAVAGAITSTAFDAAGRRLDVSWSQDRPGTSIFAVPARLYPRGFTVTGAPRWTYDPDRGLLAVPAGRGSHRVVVAPRA